MNQMTELGRRQFIATALAAGGTMVIGFRTGSALAAESQTTPWDKPAATGSSEFTPWISIAPDDTVIVRVTTPDIGNGVLTQAGAFVMEELGASWDKIDPEYASTNRDYREGGVYSGGGNNKLAKMLSFFSGRSTASMHMNTYLQVAASARERLRTAAAVEWRVPLAEIEAKESVLTHAPSGRSARFGEMAAKAAKVTLAAEPKLKDRSEWTFLGKTQPGKIQNPEIVNGSAVFGMDIQLPGKVYAALRQSPVHGGTLKSFDADAVKHMPGVLAVVAIRPAPFASASMLDYFSSKDPSPFPMAISAGRYGVAVIAEHYWQARTALDALPVEWDDGPGAKWKTTEQMNDAVRTALDGPAASVPKSAGDVDAVLGSAQKIVEASYLTPFCDHVMMEPLNGTALVTKDRVDVWHPSQHPQMGAYVAADESGIAMDNVYFHQTYVGGGFGRRGLCDDVRMVVAVAKQFPNRPVHVIWSREETTRQGKYRPAAGAKFKAGLGADGLPSAVLGRIYAEPGYSGPGIMDAAIAGVVPNIRIEEVVPPGFHLQTGPYRGPGYNSNAFFVETFIDECAVAAGIDPLEYRLKLYGNWIDPGWRTCLEELKRKSGWGGPLPKGQGRGIAISNWNSWGKPGGGTTVATVVKVEVSNAGKLKILQIDVAFDTGRILNADAVRAELEGGSVFGLNMTLNEGLTVKDGQVVEGNYDQYPMVRMGDTPPVITVHFGGLTDDARYNEIGEPPAGTIGPALGNAIFQATGKRLRQTPFRMADLSWS